MLVWHTYKASYNVSEETCLLELFKKLNYLTLNAKTVLPVHCLPYASCAARVTYTYERNWKYIV